MIEQYIYNLITGDTALQELLHKGSDDFYLYPGVIPRGEDNFTVAVAFSLITTKDVYPVSKSVTVQFNIFGTTHVVTANVAKALSDLFNEDNRQNSGGVQMVFSQRVSEGDLGKALDNEALYQREATYYFKLR